MLFSFLLWNNLNSLLRCGQSNGILNWQCPTQIAAWMCAICDLAIQAGGCPTYIHPASAKEYDTFLPKLGFKSIPLTDYRPVKGDIIVIKPPQNQSEHEHGHIAMYNGKKWISDFMQRDMYGGSIYRKNGTEYYLFRRSTGWGIRRWIL